jgi:membrane protein YqaA with SNARE-associated domain
MPLILGRLPALRRLYDWTKAWSGRPSASWALLAVACADSIFFPVPSEVLLFALYGTRPRWSLWYATVAAVGTAVGAVIGYAIGSGLQELARWILGALADNGVATVGGWLRRNLFWAVFFGSFTPFSDKLLVFGSGFFRVPFGTFLVAYILGRAVRTYPAALLFHRYGATLQRWTERYLEVVSVVFAAIILLGLALLFLLSRGGR